MILEGKPIGPDQKKQLEGELMVWRTKVQDGIQGCSNFHFWGSFSLFSFTIVA